MQRVSDAELDAFLHVDGPRRFQLTTGEKCGFDLRDTRAELAAKDEALRIATEALARFTTGWNHRESESRAGYCSVCYSEWPCMQGQANDALARIRGGTR